MAHFKLIDNTFTIIPPPPHVECASITASDQSEESVVSLSDNKILSNFSFENDLIEGDILFGQNPDIFVTKEV